MNFKKVLWAVGIILVCLLAFRIAGRLTASRNAQESRIVPVVAVNPRLGTIEEQITLSGDVKAEAEITVRPRTAGRVAEIYVQEGAVVNKGDKLLSYVANISPESEIYEDVVVKSPSDGIVGVQLFKVGEQVTALTGLVNPVFIIYAINNVKVYANVPEKYYAQVNPGTRAAIKLDAYPNETIFTKLSTVRPVVDPQTRTTQVEIVIPNSGHRLKPGMFAEVQLTLKKKSNVLIVPFDAVLGESDKYVYLNNHGVAERKLVVLGLQQGNEVEIASGLTLSDQVVTVGQRVIQDGVKIQEVTE